MASNVPTLRRGERLSPAERERIGHELLRRYDGGESIRQLCHDTGFSIGRLRRLLIDAGVTFRTRGGATRALR